MAKTKKRAGAKVPRRKSEIVPPREPDEAVQFSVKFKKKLVERIDAIAEEKEQSRNQVMEALVAWAVGEYETAKEE